jgi:predicted nucleic acid-binding protein
MIALEQRTVQELAVRLPELSEEQLRQALIRISQFVLRGDIKQIRDELQDNIVEMAFYWSPKAKGGVFQEEIARLVSDELPIINVGKPLLDNIVQRLVQKSGLEFHDKKYYLSNIRRTQIEAQARGNEYNWRRINELIASHTSRIHGATLSKEQEETILRNFNVFLAVLFMERADIIAELLTAKEANIKKIRLPSVILDTTIGYMKDFKLRRALKETIIREFQNPSEEFAKFLFQVSRNFVCVQLLNLDPECQSIEKRALKEKVLFLDTNMLMALLCERMSTHELAKECVSMSQNLGIKILYSERTLKEYRDVLERSNVAYKQLRVSERFLESVDNEFIAAFGLEKKANPNQTWDSYYYRLKHPEKLLEREYGVGFYDERHGEIEKISSFEEIAKKVSECYKLIRGREKEKDIAEHDAYHLLLMRELRVKESRSMFGPKHWFVTLDQTLYCVDETINEKMSYSDKIPSSVPCDIWIESISPFMTWNVENKKAVKLFAEILSSQFTVIPFHISTKDLTEIQGDWINYKWLETKDLAKVLNDKFVKQAVNRLKQAKEKGEPTEELTAKLEGSVKVELDSIIEAKMKTLETRLEQLESVGKDKAELEKRLQQVETSLSTKEEKLAQAETSLSDKEKKLAEEGIFRRRMRILAGTLGAALIVLNIICGAIFVVTGALPLGIYTLVYMLGLSIIGGILILIAVAYEQVSGYLGAKISK